MVRYFYILCSVGCLVCLALGMSDLCRILSIKLLDACGQTVSYCGGCMPGKANLSYMYQWSV